MGNILFLAFIITEADLLQHTILRLILPHFPPVSSPQLLVISKANIYSHSISTIISSHITTMTPFSRTQYSDLISNPQSQAHPPFHPPPLPDIYPHVYSIYSRGMYGSHGRHQFGLYTPPTLYAKAVPARPHRTLLTLVHNARTHHLSWTDWTLFFSFVRLSLVTRNVSFRFTTNLSCLLVICHRRVTLMLSHPPPSLVCFYYSHK